jgi:hypothetical protein
MCVTQEVAFKTPHRYPIIPYLALTLSAVCGRPCHSHSILHAAENMTTDTGTWLPNMTFVYMEMSTAMLSKYVS